METGLNKGSKGSKGSNESNDKDDIKFHRFHWFFVCKLIVLIVILSLAVKYASTIKTETKESSSSQKYNWTSSVFDFSGSPHSIYSQLINYCILISFMLIIGIIYITIMYCT